MSTVATRRGHVVLVTHHYAPERGAPQSRWNELARHFAAAGVTLSVLTPPPHYPTGHLQTDNPLQQPGMSHRGEHGERVVRVAYRPHSPRLVSRTIDQMIAAWSSVRRARDISWPPPSVVIATVPGIPSMFAGAAIARRFKVPFVVEMRDAWPDLIQPSKILESRRPSRVKAYITALAHRSISRLQSRADLVVTTTESFAEILHERGVRKVAVVRNGTTWTQVSPPPTAGRPGVDRPLRAVYAGTIGRAQGLGTVVEAAALAAERGLLLEVRIVGAGADVPALRRQIQSLDAPVTLHERVSREEMVDLYAWADTSIVSLRDWEPLKWTVPSKLYEVIASGNPVTAAAAGEAAEIVESLDAGVVVPPEDSEALAEAWLAWADAGVLPTPSTRALAWVEANAKPDQLAQQYLTALDEIGGL
ncbi:glycosyltransferase family 4 protein [Paraoerskovia marina]|uniref:glycosyltransferase family 4 protein n=1 Tax=Paraoerskovia marina TaxID=545619 RepID=UPI0009DE22A2|nr:glycosyltransferase family 4 protein [Paraoerskovia marina]